MKATKLYGKSSQKLGGFFSPSNPFVFQINLGRKIQAISERLDEIAAHRAKFGLDERHEERNEIGTITTNMGSHSFVRASEVIGREVDKERILRLLTKPCENHSLCVFPICGIGGLGKTTLAKLVYNDDTARSHFELRIWVCVKSEDFDLSRLVREILGSATGRAFGDLGLDQLQRCLRDALKDRRFLLVLDDVWNDIPDKWFVLRELLVQESRGSKIIVTTRKHSVAGLMGTHPTHNLSGLSQEDCLCLFLKWAFKEGPDERDQILVSIGKQIAEKCNGVPLAATTLGSLLHSKLDERDWKHVRDNEIWKLDQTEDHILPALRLSYNELPSQLKQCFRYCSLFPKGHEIKSTELTELWAAHELLPPRDGNASLEDTGESYFKELWSRSFFQNVQDCDVFYLFHMHDLIHDLATSISRTEFLVINSPAESVPERVKHISIARTCKELPTFAPKNRVRTVICPEAEHLEASLIGQMWKFRSLRMLKLRFSSFRKLPSYVGDLKHLRFLDLSFCSELRKLPDSICDLHSLQTLKLQGCGNLEALPRKVKNLISLRFLSVTTKETYFPEDGIGHLASLRTLLIFDCKSLISLPKSIRYLTGLETLVITLCTNLRLTEESDGQPNKLSLRRLKLSHLQAVVALPRWLQGCEGTLQFLRVSHCPKVAALPEWLRDISSLRKLEIVMCPRLLSLPEGMDRIESLRKVKIYGCPELMNFMQTTWERNKFDNLGFEED